MQTVPFLHFPAFFTTLLMFFPFLFVAQQTTKSGRPQVDCAMKLFTNCFLHAPGERRADRLLGLLHVLPVLGCARARHGRFHRLHAPRRSPTCRYTSWREPTADDDEQGEQSNHAVRESHSYVLLLVVVLGGGSRRFQSASATSGSSCRPSPVDAPIVKTLDASVVVSAAHRCTAHRIGLGLARLRIAHDFILTDRPEPDYTSAGVRSPETQPNHGSSPPTPLQGGYTDEEITRYSERSCCLAPRSCWPRAAPRRSWQRRSVRRRRSSVRPRKATGLLGCHNKAEGKGVAVDPGVHHRRRRRSSTAGSTRRRAAWGRPRRTS